MRIGRTVCRFLPDGIPNMRTAKLKLIVIGFEGRAHWGTGIDLNVRFSVLEFRALR